MALLKRIKPKASEDHSISWSGSAQSEKVATDFYHASSLFSC